MTRGRLYQRVFLLNAAIFVVATLVLVITPATISFPVELTEAIVLVAGLGAILVVNAFVLRAAFAPLERLMRLMRDVDPHRPGARLPASGPQEVRELVVVFNDMLDRLEHERRESARRALAAQEGERRRVAQELHDEVGQVLTGVLLRLESLARQAPPQLLPALRSAQDSTRGAMDSVSLVVRQLRPEALTDLGLAKALAALATRVGEESGLPHQTPRCDPTSESSARNASSSSTGSHRRASRMSSRHADAREVEITLERSDDQLVLRVRDDGSGLPAAQPPRHGILGMRERAMLIGATLTIENRPGSGVEVTLTVPSEQ